jgi:eukaryotic-like serine/threonine-protein kinase
VGRALGLLGMAYGEHDEYQKAVDHYRRALAVLEKSLGPWHPSVATTLNNLGFDLRLLGRREEAASAFKRALEVRERALGPNHVEVAVTLTNIGELLAEQRQWTQALAHYQRAQTIHENALGPEHPRLGWILSGLGTAYLALGMPEKAVAPLRRAVALLEGHKGTPTNLADGQYALARALRNTGRDPAEARTLALKAREAYAAGGERFRSTLEEVDAWLRAK